MVARGRPHSFECRLSSLDVSAIALALERALRSRDDVIVRPRRRDLPVTPVRAGVHTRCAVERGQARDSTGSAGERAVRRCRDGVHRGSDVRPSAAGEAGGRGRAHRSEHRLAGRGHPTGAVSEASIAAETESADGAIGTSDELRSCALSFGLPSGSVKSARWPMGSAPRLGHALLLAVLLALTRVAGFVVLARLTGRGDLETIDAWTFAALLVASVLSVGGIIGLGLLVWGRLSLGELGWSTARLGPDLARGLLGGAACCGIVLLFQMAAGASASEVLEGWWAVPPLERLLTVLVGVEAALTEETPFRGYLQPTLQRMLGREPACSSPPWSSPPTICGSGLGVPREDRVRTGVRPSPGPDQTAGVTGLRALDQLDCHGRPLTGAVPVPEVPPRPFRGKWVLPEVVHARGG